MFLPSRICLLSVSCFAMTAPVWAAAPAAPVNLSASAVSATQMDLAWEDKSSDETGFELERRLSTSKTFTRVVTLAANVKSYRDSGLGEGARYYYRVRAVNGQNSRYSNTANAWTQIKGPSLTRATPVALSLSPFQIDLNWVDNSGVEKGFRLEESLSATGPWTQVASVTANTTTYSRTDLPPDTRHYYRVLAYAGQQQSSPSAVVEAVTASPHVAAFEAPKGIYLLGDGPDLASIPGLDQPFVDGYAWRIGWTSLDSGTSAPNYDFSLVDQAVAAVQAHGKKLTIALFVQDVPQYVRDDAAQTWNAPGTRPGTTVNTVVPWDDSAQAHHRTFLQALSNHEVHDTTVGAAVRLRDHSALAQINAGILGLQGVRDVSNTLVQQPGFTREKFTDAMLESVRAVQDVFPAKPTYVAFWGLDDGQEPDYGDALLLSLLGEFDGVRRPVVGLFNEALRGDSPGPGYYQPASINGHFVMLQACGSWTLHNLCNWTPGDDSPANGFAYGHETFGTTYFEMYREDIENPAFASEFQQWHDALQ
ncbi:MAG: hypothetical protein B7Y26_09315 [Hydrogenophilales bacterium 16-64-46]|nr:MAG: hypothetical protein B7Z32_12295 [Hydrogenophilales bacterium 12-64-13]OYZ05155.1 MAG: hypothetical protein B7Y26_09315 [Hydrogenophilales bacterium 16-64-46]OZA37973.1 MAG: hypothetical protein B7X87_09245 [Hydrogenophilales bacterium 17-64-34]